MVWGHLALAIGLGLIVSCGLALVLVWPELEPDDLDESSPPLR